MQQPSEPSKPRPMPLGPTPSIRRLPRYLEVLEAELAKGHTQISCTTIAEATGQIAVQVRKDLAITGIVGRPRTGYQIAALTDSIKSFLGWSDSCEAFLIGVGSLGRAILGYSDFKQHGLDIVGAFDADPSKIGSLVHGRQILHPSKMPNLARRMNITIGVLCVPQKFAQDAADLMVQSGIRAIWNFTRPGLKLPPGVIVETVQLTATLAVLTSRLKAMPKDPNTCIPASIHSKNRP